MLETIETMARLTGARLSAQPNAGRPRDVDGRNLYLSSPDYMASYARRFIAAGVRLVGGCCGTTPDHMRQIALAVRTMAPAAARPAAAVVVPATRRPRPRSSIGARSRRSRRALADGQFAIVAEVVGAARPRSRRPPCARPGGSSDLGALAVNVPDYPKSGARASALALAVAHRAAEPASRRCCTTPAAIAT